MTPSFRPNYLFFGAYFIIISAIHLFHVFLIPSENAASSFFAVYTLGQCALETLLLLTLAAFCRHFLPGKVYRLFSALFFTLLLIHLIDFILIRFMDMSFWFALHLVLQESGENFIEMLYASNVSLFVWGLATLSAFLLIAGGILIFRWTEKKTDLKPKITTYPQVIAVAGVIALFLMTWERTGRPFTYTKQFERYEKTLPWKTIVSSSRHVEYFLSKGLQLPEEEYNALRSLDSHAFSLVEQPDIYLFVIESLREDFIQPHLAPNLSAFRDQNIHFDLALANANATQDSWFSIFFSKYPFYRGKINPDTWEGGSIPLRLLKTMGYQIHTFSSARLNYYRMDQLIFGNAMNLTHSFFSPDDIEEPYQKDIATIEQLIETMKTPSSSSRVFITFLDSTHHDYSWPTETGSHFFPFEERINYFKLAFSDRGIGLIQNRYRNALFFVDSLIGQFLQALESIPQGSKSLVVIAADHGDEFYEHGHLFHASGLTHPQMHIPLYYKFGEHSPTPQCTMTCHMDIFPSIFHYLLGEDHFSAVFQGQSIFKTDRRPHVITGRFNASRAPYEFAIHNGTEKLIARFNNSWDIFNATKIKILSVKNNHEEHLQLDQHTIQNLFDEAFDHLCAP